MRLWRKLHNFVVIDDPPIGIQVWAEKKKGQPDEKRDKNNVKLGFVDRIIKPMVDSLQRG